MTKQEEIREGIREILSGWGIGNWDIDHSAIDDLLNYLHSQGVVIKVDRELPEKPLYHRLNAVTKYERTLGYGEAQQDMLKAGYVAVEPLIKEATNGKGLS